MSTPSLGFTGYSQLYTYHAAESPVTGNDDASTADEQNDPYTDTSGDPDEVMRHAVGEVTDGDTPIHYVFETPNGLPEGAKFELTAEYLGFVRLQIGSKWFRVSEDKPWKYRLRAIYKRANPQDPSSLPHWYDNGSKCDVNWDW